MPFQNYEDFKNFLLHFNPERIGFIKDDYRNEFVKENRVIRINDSTISFYTDSHNNATIPVADYTRLRKQLMEWGIISIEDSYFVELVNDGLIQGN